MSAKKRFRPTSYACFARYGPRTQGANSDTDAAIAAMEVELFDHEYGAPDSDAQPRVWYSLTDRYAAALSAMERGEPGARRRVLAAYEQLRQMSPVPSASRKGS